MIRAMRKILGSRTVTKPSGKPSKITRCMEFRIKERHMYANVCFSSWRYIFLMEGSLFSFQSNSFLDVFDILSVKIYNSI